MIMIMQRSLLQYCQASKSIICNRDIKTLNKSGSKIQNLHLLKDSPPIYVNEDYR